MSERKIQEAIEGITPEDGAKERMYGNILRKAQQETKSRKKPLVFAGYAVAAAGLCLMIVGAVFLYSQTRENPEEGGNVAIANPIVEVDSAEAFLDMGIRMDAPAGSSDVAYTVINGEIACVDFSWEGHSYTLRASVLEEDFSGLYGRETEPEILDSQQNAVMDAVDIDGNLCYRVFWNDGEIRFILSNRDGADAEALRGVYELLKAS